MEVTARRLLVGLPIMASYTDGQSTTIKSTVLETCFGWVSTVMGSVTILTRQTLSPMKPTNGASIRRNFSLLRFIY